MSSTLFPKMSRLNEKRCFELWCQPGMSYKKVATALAEEGAISSYSGRAYTPTAIKHACWRWALKRENQQEAFEMIKQKFAPFGRIISEEEWKKTLVEEARYVWQATPKKFEAFIAGNELQKYV